MNERNTALQNRTHNQALREKKKRLGLVRVELWTHPDDAAMFREHNRKLLELRGIELR